MRLSSYGARGITKHERITRVERCDVIKFVNASITRQTNKLFETLKEFVYESYEEKTLKTINYSGPKIKN